MKGSWLGLNGERKSVILAVDTVKPKLTLICYSCILKRTSVSLQTAFITFHIGFPRWESRRKYEL